MAPLAARAADDPELAGQPTWSAPSAAAVHAEVFRWLADRKVDPAKQDEIARTIWPEAQEAKPAEEKPAKTKATEAKAVEVKKPDDTKLESKTAELKPAGPKLTDLRPSEVFECAKQTIGGRRCSLTAACRAMLEAQNARPGRADCLARRREDSEAVWSE